MNGIYIMVFVLNVVIDIGTNVKLVMRETFCGMQNIKLDSRNWWTIRAKNVKYGAEIDHVHSARYAWNVVS
jgi:hypothetical protein